MKKWLGASGLQRNALPEGEVLVQATGKSKALLVNTLADAVIDLCDGTRTIQEIANVVRETLDVPVSIDVDADVARLIAALEDAGIVHAVHVSSKSD